MPWLVILVTTAAYANSFHGAFVFDDWPTLLENPRLRTWFAPFQFWAWPAGNTASGRPLAGLSFTLNYALAGFWLPAWHAVNLAIHLAATWLVADTLTRILRRTALADRASLTGWLAAGLWAVHPLNTSAVTYVVQRTESLTALCLLITVNAFLRSVETPVRTRRWQTLSVATCAAGMASKEWMVVAPLIVWLVDGAVVSASWRDPLRLRRGYYAALAATWVWLALLVATAGRAGTEAGFGEMSTWTYLKCQAGVLWHYVRLWVWPHPLVFDYFWPAPSHWTRWLPQGLALLAVVVWGLAGTARRRLAPLAVLIALLVLAPSSSVLPLPFEVAAEHRFYLPGACLAACLAATLTRRLLPGAALACAACLMLPLAATTVRRNQDYASDLTLWTHTLARQPNHPRAALALAQIHERRGELAPAVGFATRALQSAPDEPMAQHTLGRLLARSGRPGEAVLLYEQARARKPRDPRIAADHANALILAGRDQDASKLCREILTQHPDFVPALWTLAVLHAKHLETAEARRYAERVLTLAPNDPDARQLLNRLPPR